MNNRIKRFVSHKNISAGELAELTGVQRSNISHIFNGRNKPGAQFIENFLLAFPDVNARWLLTGIGSMLNKDIRNEIITTHSEVKSETEVHYDNKKINQSKEREKIEKLLLLNADGTFSVYKCNEE
jgi:transcriptional regulator with XRE-family HTH domain